MLPLTELTIILQDLLVLSNVRILLDILECFYCVEGKTTTRSLSRYSGYSLRTIFRFLKEDIDWLGLRLLIFQKFIYKESSTYIVAVDEVVEGKSRKQSYGISTFFSSILGKPIRGICFCGLTVIDVEKRKSCLIGLEQLVYTKEDKARISKQKAERKAAKKRKSAGKPKQKGRKKGSKNKEKKENKTVSFRHLSSLLSSFSRWRSILSIGMKVSHLVGDAAYGTQDYLELAKKHSLYLISRLRDNPALYFPFVGQYKGSGRPRVYGERCNFDNLDKSFFKEEKKEKGFTYYIYQFEALSKSILGVVLNVVVVRAVREKDGKVAYKVFFSNDKELSYEKILDYYSLRFQIEFNFRDAKQYFGFSDFKNYTQRNLTNFVNLSFLMCLINKIVLEQQREKLNIPKLNTADLKVIANGQFTAKKIIKLLQEKPCLIFNNDFPKQFLPQGLIHKT